MNFCLRAGCTAPPIPLKGRTLHPAMLSHGEEWARRGTVGRFFPALSPSGGIRPQRTTIGRTSVAYESVQVLSTGARSISCGPYKMAAADPLGAPPPPPLIPSGLNPRCFWSLSHQQTDQGVQVQHRRNRRVVGIELHRLEPQVLRRFPRDHHASAVRFEGFVHEAFA